MTYEQAVARAFLNALVIDGRRRVYLSPFRRQVYFYALRRLRVRAGLMP